MYVTVCRNAVAELVRQSETSQPHFNSMHCACAHHHTRKHQKKSKQLHACCCYNCGIAADAAAAATNRHRGHHLQHP